MWFVTNIVFQQGFLTAVVEGSVVCSAGTSCFKAASFVLVIILSNSTLVLCSSLLNLRGFEPGECLW